MTRILFQEGDRLAEFGLGSNIHEKMARRAGVMALRNTVENPAPEDEPDDLEIVSGSEDKKTETTSPARSLGARALVGAVRQR